MVSLQIAQRTRIAHNFKFKGFVFFICMQEFCCLGPCFLFLDYFVPFVEIGFWYKFVHNLLILERISNITRHKCSVNSALQYHKAILHTSKMIWHHIYKAHHGVAQSSILFSKSEFAARIFVPIGWWLCRKFSTVR